jgi:hypothetical protein
MRRLPFPPGSRLHLARAGAAVVIREGRRRSLSWGACAGCYVAPGEKLPDWGRERSNEGLTHAPVGLDGDSLAAPSPSLVGWYLVATHEPIPAVARVRLVDAGDADARAIELDAPGWTAWVAQAAGAAGRREMDSQPEGTTR